jgi:hypothetical protein
MFFHPNLYGSNEILYIIIVLFGFTAAFGILLSVLTRLWARVIDIVVFDAPKGRPPHILDGIMLYASFVIYTLFLAICTNIISTGKASFYMLNLDGTSWAHAYAFNKHLSVDVIIFSIAVYAMVILSFIIFYEFTSGKLFDLYKDTVRVFKLVGTWILKLFRGILELIKNLMVTVIYALPIIPIAWAMNHRKIMGPYVGGETLIFGLVGLIASVVFVWIIGAGLTLIGDKIFDMEFMDDMDPFHKDDRLRIILFVLYCNIVWVVGLKSFELGNMGQALKEITTEPAMSMLNFAFYTILSIFFLFMLYIGRTIILPWIGKTLKMAKKELNIMLWMLLTGVSFLPFLLTESVVRREPDMIWWIGMLFILTAVPVNYYALEKMIPNDKEKSHSNGGAVVGLIIMALIAPLIVLKMYKTWGMLAFYVIPVVTMISFITRDVIKTIESKEKYGKAALFHVISLLVVFYMLW